MRAWITEPVARTGPEVPGLGGPDPADDATELAQEHGVPLLELGADRTSLSGLVGDHPEAAAWTTSITRHSHVGLSEPFLDLAQAPAHFRDAERALGVARRRATYRVDGRPVHASPRSGGLVVRFENADTVTWLLARRSEESVQAKTLQQFATLFEHPELV